MIAEKWGISRERMEEFALESHTRARTAIAEGRFEGEIEPVTLADGTETHLPTIPIAFDGKLVARPSTLPAPGADNDHVREILDR
jgi:acetyl-CoA acetyltransferase